MLADPVLIAQMLSGGADLPGPPGPAPDSPLIDPDAGSDGIIAAEVKLPDGKMLIPGVVSHATNVVERPGVVADRILTYAKVVGRENVIASTDCGLGGRVHPQIASAKLQALANGARLASQQLWA